MEPRKLDGLMVWIIEDDKDDKDDNSETILLQENGAWRHNTGKYRCDFITTEEAFETLKSWGLPEAQLYAIPNFANFAPAADTG